MRAALWPNKLGWDIGTSEVMRVTGNRLRVHTATRCALVASTSDPIEAVAMTRKDGHLRSELETMDYSDAEATFHGRIL